MSKAALRGSVSTVIHYDGPKFAVERKQDAEPILDDLQVRRSLGMVGSSDMRHIGSVPNILLERWLADAGVRYSDRPAVKEVIKRKLLDGEFAKLRAWEGTY